MFTSLIDFLSLATTLKCKFSKFNLNLITFLMRKISWHNNMSSIFYIQQERDWIMYEIWANNIYTCANKFHLLCDMNIWNVAMKRLQIKMFWNIILIWHLSDILTLYCCVRYPKNYLCLMHISCPAMYFKPKTTTDGCQVFSYLTKNGRHKMMFSAEYICGQLQCSCH